MGLKVEVVVDERVFANVPRYELRERLHELFELLVHIRVDDPALDMSALVGKRAKVLFLDDPVEPRIDGLVREVRQLTAEPTGVSRYELVVVPPIWLATRRTDCRIFQHRSVPQIVADVVNRYGPAVAAPASFLTGRPEEREYVVQYGETDWRFIQRVLSEIGATAMFAQGDATTFTLVDDTTIDRPKLDAPFIPPAGQGAAPTAPHVTSVMLLDGIETSEVTLRDYDFEKPGVVLEESAQAPAAFELEKDLERYSFAVGDWRTEAQGGALATKRLHATRALRRRLACDTSFRVAPGGHFRLTGHPRSDVDGDLLVVAAHSTADELSAGGHVRHALECIPAAVHFRPAVLPKPRIAGTQTAFVVGAEGKEIDIDEHGRVEVEFRWDRRDLHLAGASRGVRVGQAWANAGYGFLLHPRVNEEVIVAFSDGDPDEPIIVGRVYNGHSRPSVSLPAEATKSVWRSRSSPGGNGFNQILMEDQAGNELLELHAQRDLIVHAGRNSNVMFGVNHTTEVGADQLTYVKGNQTTVADATSTMIGKEIVISSQADTTLSAGGDRYDTSRNHLIKSSSTYLESKDVMQVVAPHFHVFAGANIRLKAPEVSITGESKITLTSGGSTIEITPGGIKIKSDGDVEVNGTFVKINC